VGRPKTPLINRDDAIAKALELIDRDGIDDLSIRRLGAELGVNGASLYHHFKDKDEILNGACRLVMREARVAAPAAGRQLTWRQYATRSVARYRMALLRHPNIAPLMAPGVVRPMAIASRDYVISLMIAEGVPARFTYPIIDSIETLAYGSAMLNPRQLRPRERFPIGSATEHPNLHLAMRSTFASAERLFRFELESILDGWGILIEQERTSHGKPA
jgi:TetR/AcrR family transcriptional regulator, tetracycline repressor protein